LGVTFAFLGDEIYLKAGAPLPSRAHYGKYPQIEDGVGMIRSFLGSFERLFKKVQSSEFKVQSSLNGTILTGEMFAPILHEQIEKLNSVINSRLRVLAVPNTYFGGDVAVAGLLTGQDFLAVKDKIVGDFVLIPKHTVKSDEPIFLDGMSFDALKAEFDVPVFALDAEEFIKNILDGKTIDGQVRRFVKRGEHLSITAAF